MERTTTILSLDILYRQIVGTTIIVRMIKLEQYLLLVKCLSKFFINILNTPSASDGLLQASPMEHLPPFKSCHMTIGTSQTPRL